MKRRYLCFLCAIWLFCGAACQQQAFHAAVAEREAVLVSLRQEVQSAARAEVQIYIPAAKSEKHSLPVPPEQLARLKDILSRLRPVPPAMGEEYFICALWLAYADIRFSDAKGDMEGRSRVFSIITPKSIMPESEAKGLSPRREKDPYEAWWYLPDADYAQLEALPIITRARRLVDERIK